MIAKERQQWKLSCNTRSAKGERGQNYPEGWRRADISIDAKIDKTAYDREREREKGRGSLSEIQPMKMVESGPTINLHETRASLKTDSRISISKWMGKRATLGGRGWRGERDVWMLDALLSRSRNIIAEARPAGWLAGGEICDVVMKTKTKENSILTD
jgi:hypothetical protein